MKTIRWFATVRAGAAALAVSAFLLPGALALRAESAGDKTDSINLNPSPPQPTGEKTCVRKPMADGGFCLECTYSTPTNVGADSPGMAGKGGRAGLNSNNPLKSNADSSAPFTAASGASDTNSTTPDCDTCSECPADGNKATDAPDVLPSLGEAVHLQAVAGGRSSSVRWGRHIGFGPQFPLNYLNKILLTSDRRFAQLSLPADQAVICFERVDTSWTYNLAENEVGLGTATAIVFTDANEDGLPESAVVTFPDQSTWDFAFETNDPAVNRLPGAVYRVLTRTTRTGRETGFAYNSNNVTITDASGHAYVCAFTPTTDFATQMQYDRITTITVAGRSWTYTYSGVQHPTVTETNNQTGQTIATSVDAALGLVTSIVIRGADDTQLSLVRQYDSSGLLTGLVRNGVAASATETWQSADGRARTTTISIGTDHGALSTTQRFGREGMSGLTNSTDGTNHAATFTRDARFMTTAMTDRNGNAWSWEYDDNGYLTRQTDPENGVVGYGYDSAYNLTQVTGHDGTWAYAYDSTRRLTKATLPNGGIVYYQYSTTKGLVQCITRQLEASPDQWARTYIDANDNGQATFVSSAYEVTNPLAAAENPPPTVGKHFYYDAYGNLTRQADELGHATDYQYDAANRLTHVTDACNASTSYAYDSLGRKTMQTDNCASTNWHYDSRGFVTGITGSASGGGGSCGSCGQAAGCGARLGTYEYSGAGLLTKYSDLNTHEWKYEYDLAGNKTRETNPLNYPTDYTYDGEGRVLTVTDANGNATTYAYTKTGQLSTVTNAEDETTGYFYDTHGRQTMVQAPDTGTTATAYDNLDRVTSTTDALGHVTHFYYDLAGRRTLTTFQDSTWEKAYYDPEGNLTRSDRGSDDLHLLTDFIYDDAGRRTRTRVDPDGLDLQTDYEYDNVNRLTEVWSPEDVPSNYVYDNCGRQVTSTAGGVTTSTVYNNAGWVTSRSNGVTTTAYEYDPVGNRTLMTVSGRAGVAYEYDAANQLTRTSQTDNGNTIITDRWPLDPAGRVTKQTDPAGYTTEYVYDGANRVTQVIQQITLDPPTYEPTGYVYDPNGRLSRVAFDTGSTRDTAYDLLGEVTDTDGGPDGGKHFVYESMGRLSTVTDAENRIKQYFYDDLGRLTQELDPLTNPTDYLYDIAGRRTAIIDANGNQTNYVYNDDSQVTELTYPPVTGQSANVEAYIYSAETGQLRTKTTPNNVDIEYLYEPDGQLASEGGVNYDYDDAGAITDDGVMTYAYNLFGHRTSATSASLSRAIAYTYDLRGLRTRLEVGGVVTIAYALDGAGRLTRLQKGTDTAAQYIYDTGGRRRTLILPNGVTTVYDYDTNDRVTDIVTTKSGTGTLASFTYTLDDTGIPTDVDQSLMAWDSGQSQWVLQSQTIGYSLDGNGRLIAETRTVGQNPPTATYSESFVYDPVGNRTSRTLNSVGTANTFNERNQLVSSLTNSVTTNYTYDQNGNTLTSSGGGVTKSMAYDKFNRQTSWGDGTDSEATVFAGARWHRTSYATNGGGDTRFLYDGDNVLADFVEDGGNPGSYIASKVYVTPFLDDNLSMTVLSGEQAGTYYYTGDRRHSVVTLTNASGAMVNAYDLTAMGERLPGTHVSGRVEGWRGGLAAPAPAPARSNVACGFPALRFPACFLSRVMGPWREAETQPGAVTRWSR